MKPIPTLLLIALVGAAGAAGGYFFACQTGHNHATHDAAASAEQTLYTCGMHSQVIQDQPGNCPICGMKLTRMRKDPGSSNQAVPAGDREVKYYKSTMIPGEVRETSGKDSMGMEMVPVYEDEATMDASIAIDPVTIQNMGLRTMILTNGPLRRVIRTVGTVDYEEPALEDVTTKFSGWVEKLYVDAVGAQVHRGDPLFEVYSPELYSAQQEYLLALKSGPASDGLLQTARTKLKYWDVSDDQIAELERNLAPSKTLRVLAPIDGFVLEKKVVEGQMVGSGMKLYRLADLALVWVHAQLYEQDLPFVGLGQEAVVNLSYLPDRKFRGRVTYIYPTVDPKTRTVQIRMEFHNPGYYLKPGMFTSVELASELAPSALLVPDMAVLRSGDRNTVFVALDGGRFLPRHVTLGARAENDMLQVLNGLKAGDRIVTSGQFLLDSESQLREAIQKMLEPGVSASAHSGEYTTAHGRTETPSSDDTGQSTAGEAVYICPMPEHVAIEYDHPGPCPLCGMALVPVSSDTLQKVLPGGTVEYYTCPMPEHSDVHLDQPGKCPRCRMTLIPVMSKPPLASEHVTPEPGPALYTCPMKSHSHIVSNEAGKCPECEMTLVPVDTVDHGAKSREIWGSEHPGTENGHED